jgi:hypothetical protein
MPVSTLVSEEYGKKALRGLGEDQICAVLRQYFAQIAKTEDVHVYKVSADNTREDFSLVDQLLSQGILTAEKNYLVIPLPVNNGAHSTIIVVNRTKHEISFIDSYANPMPAHRAEELKILFPDYVISVLTDKSLSQQHDSWSCGIHAISNAIGLVDGSIDLSSRKGLEDAVHRDTEALSELFVHLAGECDVACSDFFS